MGDGLPNFSGYERNDTPFLDEKRVWFVYRESKHFGPYSESDLKALLQGGAITPDHFLWRPDQSKWVPISNFDVFVMHYTVPKHPYSDRDFEDREFDLLGGKRRLFRYPISTGDQFKAKGHNDTDFTLPGKLSGVDFNPDSAVVEASAPSLALRRKGRYIGGFVLGLLALSLFLVVILLTSPHYDFGSLSQGDVERLKRTTKYPIEVAPKISYAFSLESNDQFGYFATNLPEGSVVEITLAGVAGSTVGAIRPKIQFEFEVSDRGLVTQPLRMEDGKFLPPGKYLLSSRCVSCDSASQGLVVEGPTTVSLYLPKTTDEYQSLLKKYHIELNQKAQAELFEISEIIGHLKSLSLTLTKAINAVKPEEQRSLLSPLLLQKESMEGLFKQLEDANFSETIFYLDVYKELSGVSSQMFRLAEKVSSTHSKPMGNSFISQGTKKIESTIQKIEGQINHLSILIAEQSGYPPERN